jgi:hypothetical protein
MGNKDFLILFLNAIIPDNFGIRVSLIDEIQEQSQSAPNTPTIQEESSEIERVRRHSLPPPIRSLQYLPTQDDGFYDSEKMIVYDILAVTDQGAFVNIEMQRAGQKFFKDRLLYYTAKLVSKQGFPGKRELAGEEGTSADVVKKKTKITKVTGTQKKSWDYELSPVFSIAICDFKVKSLRRCVTCSKFLFRSTEILFVRGMLYMRTHT